MGWAYTSLRYVESDENIIRDQNHPVVKLIRSLHSRAERERTGLFFVQGDIQFVHAIRRKADIDLMVFAPELSGRNTFINELFIRQMRDGANCYALAPDIYKSICYDGFASSYIGIVARQRWHRLENVSSSPALCWVALDQAPDFRDVGTILSTSNAIGAAGAILLDERIDVYDPKCIHASNGAIFSQKLVRAQFRQFVKWKRDTGRQTFLVGVDLPEKSPVNYRDVSYRKPAVFLMSHTHLTLPSGYRDICDCIVHIPTLSLAEGRREHIDSATTAGLLLYEIFNQQRGILHKDIEV